MPGWYARSVFFVSDLDEARKFYVDRLEFSEAWNYEENGNVIVVQVNRGGCEIILAIDADRAGQSRLFVALEEDELASLQQLIATNSIDTVRGWWGYPVIELRDPDGNELLFPVEADE